MTQRFLRSSKRKLRSHGAVREDECLPTRPVFKKRETGMNKITRLQAKDEPWTSAKCSKKTKKLPKGVQYADGNYSSGTDGDEDEVVRVGSGFPPALRTIEKDMSLLKKQFPYLDNHVIRQTLIDTIPKCHQQHSYFANLTQASIRLETIQEEQLATRRKVNNISSMSTSEDGVDDSVPLGYLLGEKINFYTVRQPIKVVVQPRPKSPTDFYDMSKREREVRAKMVLDTIDAPARQTTFLTAVKPIETKVAIVNPGEDIQEAPQSTTPHRAFQSVSTRRQFEKMRRAEQRLHASISWKGDVDIDTSHGFLRPKNFLPVNVAKAPTLHMEKHDIVKVEAEKARSKVKLRMHYAQKVLQVTRAQQEHSKEILRRQTKSGSMAFDADLDAEAAQRERCRIQYRQERWREMERYKHQQEKELAEAKRDKELSLNELQKEIGQLGIKGNIVSKLKDRVEYFQRRSFKNSTMNQYRFQDDDPMYDVGLIELAGLTPPTLHADKALAFKAKRRQAESKYTILPTARPKPVFGGGFHIEPAKPYIDEDDEWEVATGFDAQEQFTSLQLLEKLLPIKPLDNNTKGRTMTAYALYHAQEPEEVKWAAKIRLTPELLARLQDESFAEEMSIKYTTEKSEPSTLRVGNEVFELHTYPEDKNVNHLCTMSAQDNGGYAFHETGRISKKLLVQRLLDGQEKDRIKDRHLKSVEESKSRSSKLIDSKPTERERKRSRTIIWNPEPKAPAEPLVKKQPIYSSSLTKDQIETISEQIAKKKPVEVVRKPVVQDAITEKKESNQSEKPKPIKHEQPAALKPKQAAIDTEKLKAQLQLDKPVAALPSSLNNTKQIRAKRRVLSPALHSLSCFTSEMEAIFKKYGGTRPSFRTITTPKELADANDMFTDLTKSWSFLEKAYSIEVVLYHTKAITGEFPDSKYTTKSKLHLEGIGVVKALMEQLQASSSTLHTAIT
ncbi:hypothetical protein THRCLA_06701, partial [Thraustotheca clavata]